ncbi:helix-turn-helix transcriptional regulator [Tropicimonas marinistellae]|uniref:helix-turn-helix transcriptional regulator n=1 Tax=Tropicimonas marinistellae TaxID=1739787 RepID=UPI00083179EE|nr:DNA-binding protein [Tropicimonas marinistellae]
MDPLIRDVEGAAILSISKATWWRRVADGTLPKPLKIGGMSRWRRSDALAVLARVEEDRVA